MSSTKEYTIGEWYEGLGRYIGIVDVYPYGEKFFLRNHKFAENVQPNSREVAKINEILIESIPRTDV
jgi:hypothetical protein